MKKCDEIRDPKSCLNKADDNEMLFVLLGRDRCAEMTIKFWIEERIRCGLNSRSDPQIQEAMDCAQKMMREYLGRLQSRLEKEEQEGLKPKGGGE